MKAKKPSLKQCYVNDLLGCMQAPSDHPRTKQVSTALMTLPLADVKAIHELYIYCETH